MPVILSSVKLHWRGATGVKKASGGREYTVIYFLQTSAPQTNAELIISTFEVESDLPGIGSYYQFGNDLDTTAFCDSITPRRIDGHRNYWEVVLHYASIGDEQGENDNGEPTGNPLEWRDEIETSFETITEPAEQATYLGGFAGQAHALTTARGLGPIWNSALQVLDPPPEHRLSLFNLRITKYKAAWPAADMAYQDAINANPFTIKKTAYNFKRTFPVHSVRLSSLTTSFAITNGVKHYRCVYELQQHPRGWIIESQDRGLHMRALAGDWLPFERYPIINLPGGGKGRAIPPPFLRWPASPPGPPDNGPYRIRDASGQPIQDPVLLNGDGFIGQPGQPAIYSRWLVDQQLDFSKLKL